MPDCLHAKLLKSCPTLCNPMDYSLPDFSVHWILQTSGLPYPPPGDLPDPGMKRTFLRSLALADGFFTTWEVPHGKPLLA